MTGDLEVRCPTDRSVALARSFDAPRHLVFDAWTKPELLMRWYGARGWNLVVCEVDVRVGGAWRFVSHGPGGAVMGQSGVYREIARPGRLVYTERFDDQSYPGESLITHVFVEERGRTEVTSTVLLPSREAREIIMRYPMARGVTQSYERLDAVLADVGASPAPPSHDRS